MKLLYIKNTPDWHANDENSEPQCTNPWKWNEHTEYHGELRCHRYIQNYKTIIVGQGGAAHQLPSAINSFVPNGRSIWTVSGLGDPLRGFVSRHKLWDQSYAVDNLQATHIALKKDDPGRLSPHRVVHITICCILHWGARHLSHLKCRQFLEVAQQLKLKRWYTWWSRGATYTASGFAWKPISSQFVHYTKDKKVYLPCPCINRYILGHTIVLHIRTSLDDNQARVLLKFSKCAFSTISCVDLPSTWTPGMSRASFNTDCIIQVMSCEPCACQLCTKDTCVQRRQCEWRVVFTKHTRCIFENWWVAQVDIQVGSLFEYVSHGR